MVKVVLLAAGKSSRTTQMKQLYKIDGEFLINLQIQKLLSYGFNIVVVLGHNAKEIASVIKYKNIEIIYNKNYEKGMLSSVQSTLIQTDATKFLFCHIDRPLVKKELFLELLQTQALVATLFCCNKKAPPILIDVKLKQNLLQTDYKRLDYWVESIKQRSYIEVKDETIHHNANNDELLKRYFQVKNL